MFQRFAWVGVVATLLLGSGAEAASFRDTNGHWAESYISTLTNAGVISGFPDGTFRPNQLVTRAQFATIVNRAFQVANTQGFAGFRDVPGNHWAAPAIGAAAANNLVTGFPDGSFRPEQPVTRTESWIVLLNGLGRSTSVAAQPQNLFNRYRDAAAVPNWALGAVAAASQANLIVTYPDPNLLEPNRAATRAEVAAFTVQALAQRGQLGPIGQNSNFFPNQGFNIQLRTVIAGSPLRTMNPFNERLYVSPSETRPISLVVMNPIRNEQGEILVPYGSRVDGRFEPAPGGTRFVSESVIINNQMFPLAAQSEVIRDIKDPRYTNTGKVIQDAAIGAAAGALLGALTGDRVVATEEVVGAGVAGVAIGNVTAPQVVVIEPQQAIDLRLTRDLNTSR